MKELLIIRHGESDADLMNVYEGRADFPLTERGHKQAKAMARFVHDHYTLAAIYSSPLKRAHETATYLSKLTDVPITADDHLMEFNNGLIAGLNREVANEQYPYIEDLPLHEAVYEQESALSFRFRADYILSKIIADTQPSETVAVIAHGGIINQLYRTFLRLPVDSNIYFATGDTGIHIWHVDESRRIVLESNITSHAAGI